MTRTTSASRDVHFISGLMAHRVPFLVAELGADVESPRVEAKSAKYARHLRRVSKNVCPFHNSVTEHGAAPLLPHALPCRSSSISGRPCASCANRSSRTGSSRTLTYFPFGMETNTCVKQPSSQRNHRNRSAYCHKRTCHNQECNHLLHRHSHLPQR